MTKRIATRFSVLAAVHDRWSPRSFADRQPEAGKLQSLFEAARLAPSAHNTQPARFLVTRKGRGDGYARLFACLTEGNRVWAHSAPVLILAAVMRERFSQERGAWVPYPHCLHDLGLAVMSMLVQATHVGLHCHPMAGFEPDQAQREFAIPPLFEPGIVIAVGYRGDPQVLPDALRAKELGPRIRRPLEEVVFENAWGRASPLFIDNAVDGIAGTDRPPE